MKGLIHCNQFTCHLLINEAYWIQVSDHVLYCAAPSLVLKSLLWFLSTQSWACEHCFKNTAAGTVCLIWKAISATLYIEGKSHSCASSLKKVAKRQYFQFVGNGLFLQTALTQITVGFFGGNFWWIKSTLTPAGASANWHERAEGRTCTFEDREQNFLLSVLLCPGVLSICCNVQSLSVCLTWPSGCFPELLLSRIQEHTMVLAVLKCMRLVCLYQNTVPWMRLACQLTFQIY